MVKELRKVQRLSQLWQNALQECQRCAIISYCNAICRMDNQKRGHDKYRKIIWDRRIKETWVLDWQQFGSFLAFPCAVNEPDIWMAMKHTSSERVRAHRPLMGGSICQGALYTELSAGGQGAKIIRVTASCEGLP